MWHEKYSVGILVDPNVANISVPQMFTEKPKVLNLGV